MRILCAVVVSTACVPSVSQDTVDATAADVPSGARDQTGFGATVVTGAADATFFTALGTNGRSCGTCHDQTTGWTVTPAGLQARFAATGGTDPIFRPVDGAVSPTADVSTVAARETAYAMLLAKAVLRIDRPVPATADFTVIAVDDPYGYATATNLAVFRRPRPSSNLRFSPTVMWDGREPDLTSQATDATLGHAQATAVDPAQIAAIVAFESSIYDAQRFDDVAGDLATDHCDGGPDSLATQPAAPGSPDAFTLFAAWSNATGTDAQSQRRASIARGERLFDTRPIQIANVAGIADQRGTCSTCHDRPNAGAHATALALDLGLAAPPRRTPDEPLYTLRRTSDGKTLATMDPGRALVTGAFADASEFEVPVLRGLAMRAPYFHDGSAPTLAAVVAFYDTRFRLGLSPQDRADLVAFLSAL